MKEPNEDIRENWTEEIKQVFVEAMDILESREMFTQYNQMVNDNSSIQYPADFHYWVRKNYAAHVSVSIRRQLDIRKDVISFKRLLEEIAREPWHITKDWYANQYNNGPAKGFGTGDFESYFGLGSHVDRKIVKEDIRQLDDLGQDIKDYVDNMVAHTSIQSFNKVPTFDQLDKFINEYEQLVMKYYMLFTQAGYSALTPIPQYDQWEIFTKPWIIKKGPLDD